MDVIAAKQYKFLIFLILIIAVQFVCHTLFQNKYIMIGFGVMSLGSVFVPLYKIFLDIFTEVYGLKISMRVYWASTFSWIIFDLLCYITINLPSSYESTIDNSYKFILNYAIFNIVTGVFLSTLVYKVNAYLLIRWKILLKGKYFWLRSLASTLIGDAIFLTLVIPCWLWFGPTISGKEAIQLSLSSLIIRIFLYSILAFPSSIIVSLLKIIEQTTVYDHGFKFNPFKKEKSMEI